jgi:hypothetical protein
MDPQLLIVITAAIAALFGFLGVAYKLSGRIATTEAGQLWAEAEKMRLEYREEIGRLQAVVDRFELRVKELEKRNNYLVGDNLNLSKKVQEHEQTISTLRSQVNDLGLENQRERAKNDKLRSRVMELELDNGRSS